MNPDEFDAERFSRWIAYVLRHNPARYGLQPDQHGFVALEAFLDVARRRYPEMSSERLQAVVTTSGTERFHMDGARIRARYGHSIPVDPIGPAIEPPPSLYQGTESARTAAVLSDGLQPYDRRLLHLSGTLDEGYAVARRKTDQPAVVHIDAQAAHQAGVEFYHEGRVYLARHVPAQFLTLAPLGAVPVSHEKS